jgi:hypothetical protein
VAQKFRGGFVVANREAARLAEKMRRAHGVHAIFCAQTARRFKSPRFAGCAAQWHLICLSRAMNDSASR